MSNKKITDYDSVYYESKDKSSFIQRVVWNRTHKVMVVDFKTKASWAYSDISEEIFVQFITSDSLGHYFNKNIRNKVNGIQLIHVSSEGVVTKVMDSPFDV